MVLPVSSIEAEVDAPGVVEVRPGQRHVRVTVRVTLRNASEDTVVLHAPSRDHEHFWHVFDESARELEREPGPGKGTKKAPTPRTFRSLTLAPGAEWHETRNVRIASSKISAGRYLLRSEFWGQPAETEFVAVVRPRPEKSAKKKAAKKKAAKKKAVGKKAGKKTSRKRAPAKRKVAPKKEAAKAKPARKKTAKKKDAKQAAPKRRRVDKKTAAKTKKKAAKKKTAPK